MPPLAGNSPAPLVTVILTYNEELNLPVCLASLQGLHTSVTVVDSGSTDRTVEIARAAGARVMVHPFENYAAQRNWAQENLSVEAPWILHLDADERLTPELVAEINRTLDAPAADANGYLLRKRTMFMGRWIRHGGHYPSYHLRLYRRGRGFCEQRLYDQHFVVPGGSLRKLDNDYLDVVASNVATWTLRHKRWAELEAEELSADAAGANQVSPKLFGNPIERRRWLRNSYGRGPLFLRAFSYWFYRYVIRRGFLDGKEGLIFHFLQGLWFRFLVDAMIFERRNPTTLKHS